MTVNDANVIDKLVTLGLNPREARLYFSLLRVSEATAAELDRLASVPRTKIYEVLGHMITKGYCIERLEGGKKFYRATKPSEIETLLLESWDSENLKWETEDAQNAEEQNKRWDDERERKEAAYSKKREKEREKRVLDQKKQRETIHEVFSGLDDLFKISIESDPALEKVQILRSKERIHLKYLELMEGCQFEVLSFTRSPYSMVDDETRAKQATGFHDLLARGASARTVYMVEEQDKHWLEPKIREFRQKGEEMRMVDELPIKMFVFDRKIAMIALPSVPGLTGADFTMLVIDDPGFVQAGILLFEGVWIKGKTPEEWVAKDSTE